MYALLLLGVALCTLPLPLCASEVITITLKRKAPTQVFEEQGALDKRSAKDVPAQPTVNLALEAPVIPLLPTITESWTTDVYSIVKFLLVTDNTTRWPQNHVSITPLKLQKLLYYAQGSALALYGRPLFTNFPLLRWQLGPVVRPIYDLFAGKDDAIVPIDYTDKLSRYDHTTLAPEQQRVLLAVSLAKSDWTGSQLVSATHSEEPVLLVSQNEEIGVPSLKNYFRTVEAWCDSIIHQLLLEQPLSEYIKLIDYMRSFISFKLTEDEIKSLHEKLSENRELISNCDSLANVMAQTRYCKWPHQVTAFQGFLGHLFFPVQLELGFETDQLLCTLPHIQKMLAYSAQHNNPLAQQLLGMSLDLYAPKDTENEDDDTDRRHLPQAVADQIAAACIDDGNPRPYFYTSLLCLLLSKFSAREAYLLKASQQGDSVALYNYYCVCCPEGEREAAFEALKSSHEGYAFLFKADSSTHMPTPDRIALYERAGNAGIVIGYFKAAQLALSVPNLQQAYGLFLKAAQGHMTSAYDHCAEIALRENRTHDAVNLYVEKGKMGDPRGFCQVGELIKTDDPFTASKLFNIDPFFGYQHSLTLEITRDTAQKLKREFLVVAAERFTSLTKTAGFHYA